VLGGEIGQRVHTPGAQPSLDELKARPVLIQSIQQFVNSAAWRER
jgi:hypothetical protein